MILSHIVKFEESAKSLKEILNKNLHISKNLIRTSKQNNGILLNNLHANVDFPVLPGDKITISLNYDKLTENIVPQNMPIDILYEDNSLIAINKHPNTVIHPTFNHPDKTIANALAYYFKNTNQTLKIRPVSRLDKDTSGIIIFAKNQYVQDNLITQMKNNSFKKEYLGVVENQFTKKAGIINLPIARKPGSMILRHVSPEGAISITHYKTLKVFKHCSFIKFILKTGRTHQIRVHCQSVGNPLIGDTLYNKQSNGIKRQALHSAKVKFIHPETKKHIKLYASLPSDIKDLILLLKNC